jgi:hypothetical protein
MAARESESGLWMAVGILGAIGLGIALIPLRSVTSASNLAFAFLILTVVIAEVGGRAAGLATAVVSALSLNFFLTEPYLTLTIHRPDDIVAFGALAVSGLVAAAFGRRRARTAERADVTRRDLDALARLAEGLLGGEPLETVLDDLRRAFGLGAIVVRRADEGLVGAVPSGRGAQPSAATALERRTLLPTGAVDVRYGERGVRLPDGGGRLRLGPPDQPLWVDLWEDDPAGLSADDCQALAVALAMVELGVRPGGHAPTSPRYTGR